MKGYTPVKLSVSDWNGNNYAVFNADGIPVYKSNTEIFTMIYEGDLCIGEIKGDSIQVSDAKKINISQHWNGTRTNIIRLINICMSILRKYRK